MALRREKAKKKIRRRLGRVKRFLRRGLRYAAIGIVASSPISIPGVTGLIRGSVEYKVPYSGPTPALTGGVRPSRSITLKPTHMTYMRAEYSTPHGWSEGPLKRMHMFIDGARGIPEAEGLRKKYVTGKDLIVRTEDAAMRAGVSKSQIAIDLKRKARGLGLEIPDHEIVDLARRIISERAAPRVLRPFLLESQIHLGHIEAGGRKTPSYLVTHPGITEAPVPLEMYLRQKHDPEHLEILGRHLDKLLTAYGQSAPQFFGNFLNMAKPDKPRVFHSWGKGMYAYGDLGSRSVGIVQTKNGPEVRIINPVVLGYCVYKPGVGPFLTVRYRLWGGAQGPFHKYKLRGGGICPCAQGWSHPK